MAMFLKVFFKDLIINTQKRRELIDITLEAAKALSDSKIIDGICVINSTHTTSSIIINENENGLKEDIINKIIQDFPQDGSWRHNRIDNNADAHLAGAYFSSSVTIPVKNGGLMLGTWQSIFFLELDGPRIGRKLIIEIMGI